MFHLLIKPLLGVAGEAVKGIVATKKAKAANMSTAAFGKKVRGNPKDYSSRTVKQANLAKTLSKLRG